MSLQAGSESPALRSAAVLIRPQSVIRSPDAGRFRGADSKSACSLPVPDEKQECRFLRQQRADEGDSPEEKTELNPVQHYI